MVIEFQPLLIHGSMQLIFLYLSKGLIYLFSLMYVFITLYTLIKILLNTERSSKTIAYIFSILFLPVVGIVFYYAFGTNIRRSKLNKVLKQNYKDLKDEFQLHFNDDTDRLILKNQNLLAHYSQLVRFIKNLGNEDLSVNTHQLLLNGEEKFPELLETLNKAEQYIHLEYYAWENDRRGNQIKEILLKKAKEGVKVRAIYDAYASRKIKHNIVKTLREGGVEIYPIIDIKLVGFANRINHRDHRKIAIIDGIYGFVGGINLSDRYDNSIDTGLYWRDTHLKITGPGVMNLQRHFMVSWNACQKKPLKVNEIIPQNKLLFSEHKRTSLSQVIAGGPIYDMSNVMLSYTRIFTLAREKLYITNPYFIPNETIADALKQAAKSGVDVRLLLPKKSDSVIVGAASKHYYEALLLSGVKIFEYEKGFIHAKTVVTDNLVSVVGTANMDIRSFDLNFEIMSVIYDATFALDLENSFLEDLKFSEQIDCQAWLSQGKTKQLFYATARLISSFL